MNTEDAKKSLSKRSTQFQPGTSGNPKGRPKGSKNKTTELKLALENNLTEHLSKHALKILKKAISMAENGDSGMIKLLIERMVPIRKAADDSPDRSAGGIKIVVQTTGDTTTSVEGEIIEQETDDEE